MTPRLLYLHMSPFSERVQWAFESEQVPFERVPYAVVAGEEELVRLTGQRQVPALLAGEEVIADSTAILEWLEAHAPQSKLMPEDPRERAQVMLHEDLACAVLGPEARHLLTGRLLASPAPLAAGYGRFLAKKYGHSPFAEHRARASVRRALAILGEGLRGRRYLVGDRFTRADLTVAAMLMVVRPPPEELYVCAPSWMRSMFDDTIAADVEVARLLRWRDAVYTEHRGGVVRPA